VSNVESRAAQSAARQGPQASAGVQPGEGTPVWSGDPSLGRTIERDLVPRLLLAHRAGPFPPLEQALITRATTAVCADERHTFLELVLGSDEDAATHFVAQMVARGVSVEAVYLDLLAPTAVQLGRLWESDERDFFEVTVALGRVQRALREAGQREVPPPAPADGRQILLSSLPGEQHTLGLAMVAEFFVRDGWCVQVGAPATPAELSALVTEGWLDVVGFSVTCESSLLTTRREVATARRVSQNPHLVVLVGGRVFTEHPDLVARVGADGSAALAADAPDVARRLVGQRAG